MLLRSLVGFLGSVKALLCKLLVIFSPESCGLSAAGCEVESCSSRRRFDDTLHFVVSRSYAQCSPLFIVSLVVSHTLVVAAVNYHLEHPVHFPAGFIEKVGILVVVFGNIHSAVSVDLVKSVLDSSFVLVLHQPEGKTAVYDIFAVVAGIVPASGDIDRTAAALVAPCLLDLSHILRVTGFTGESLLVAGSDELALDLDAAAVLVEVVQRVIEE